MTGFPQTHPTPAFDERLLKVLVTASLFVLLFILADLLGRTIYDNLGIPETITQTGGGQPDSTITRAITPYGQIGSESVAFDGGTTTFAQTWDGAGRRV